MHPRSMQLCNSLLQNCALILHRTLSQVPEGLDAWEWLNGLCQETLGRSGQGLQELAEEVMVFPWTLL